MSFMKSFTTSMVLSSLIGLTHLSYSMEPENKTNHKIVLASTLVSLNFSHQASAREKMTEKESDEFTQKFSKEGITGVEPGFEPDVGQHDFSIVFLDNKKVDFERTLFPILVELKNNTTVTALNLECCGDPRLWDYVADILKVNKTLKSLNLRSMFSSFRLYSCISPSKEMLNFEGQTNLTKLNISSLFFDLNTFNTILSSLRNCMSLTSLNISDTYLTYKIYPETDEAYEKREESETREILSLLPVSLESLKMNSNNLHDASMRVFSSWLPDRTKLTYLQLSENEFGDLGASELSQGLFKNTTLTHLDVSSNYIQFKGMYDILLRSGSSIKFIDFSCNTVVSDDSMYQLLDQYRESYPELVIKHDGPGRFLKSRLLPFFVEQ